MKTDGRYEIKFILDEYDCIKAKRWLTLNTTATYAYPTRQVNSIYFDNNEFQSVKDNLSGISDRLKIRLRWYNDDKIGSSEPILELKRRKGRLGFKQQILMPELKSNIMELSISDITHILNSKIIKDSLMCNVFNQYLNPTLYVRYSRSYYASHTAVRITEDENIDFSYIVPSKKLSELSITPYPNKVMELKFLPESKDEISHWLKHLHLVPKRHSKYLIGLALFGQVRYL